MKLILRNHDRKGAWTCLLVLAIVGVGYLGGRFHIIGRTRSSVAKSLFSSSTQRPRPNILLHQGHIVENARTYAEINAVLNKRLENQYHEASHWLRLLETTNPSERSRIVAELRRKLVTLLHPWPGPRTELRPQRKLWFSRDGVDVWLVTLSTHPDVSITCALLMPRKVTNPRPALLVLHGMYGNLESIVSDTDYHHAFGLKLAQNGFIVLAPLRVASTINARSTLYIKSLASGWMLESMDLWQLVRAVDYLYSLEQVDREHIGVYGISLGGQHALKLSALDQRLSLTISSAYFTNRFGWLFKRKSPPPNSRPGASATFPPGDRFMDIIEPIFSVDYLPSMNLLFDDLNLVALIAPRFVGIESGINDPRHDAAVTEFEKVSRLYHHVGYPGRALLMPFDGGHEVSVETSMPFLKKWVETPSLTQEQI